MVRVNLFKADLLRNIVDRVEISKIENKLIQPIFSLVISSFKSSEADQWGELANSKPFGLC